MKTSIILISLLLIVQLQAQQTELKGKVLDYSGNPLPFVTVFIENSSDGAITDTEGLFRFTTKKTGRITLNATLIGYKKAHIQVEIGKDDTDIELRLEETVLVMKEAVVTASSFGSAKEKGIVLNKTDILMTPGGAADIFQSLKTLPGLTQVSESAELYVRGGDPIETITIIDGAVMYHPFTLESGYGGLFSNVKTNFVKGLYFSSGGFSAKYGNALSAVVDIETKSAPEKRQINMGLSLANASLSADIPWVSGSIGTLIEFDRSFTAPIFFVNGGQERFTQMPVTQNVTVSNTWQYSKSGKIKILTIRASDDQGVKVDRAEYAGTFSGKSENLFNVFQWSDILSSSLFLKFSASHSTHNNSWNLGVLDLDKEDAMLTARADFDMTLSKESRIKFGAEAGQRKLFYKGSVPENNYDIRPEAERTILDERITVQRYGVYTEYERINLLGIQNVSASIGIRGDFIPSPELHWINPRLSIGYTFTKASKLMASFGIFNQMPDPRLMVAEDGNPNLKSMKAYHYIAAYELANDENNSMRIEIYRKVYDNLPVEDKLLHYSSDGYGSANGLDIIIKNKTDFGFEGWLSYGYIKSKRYWMDYNRELPSTSDITHNLTLILKYFITPQWQTGINLKYATGKPFTPVTSAEWNSIYNIYTPVYGETNSDRFPEYKRLDLRVTHFSNISESLRFIFFVEGLNIFNLNNIFGYYYSPDYKMKKEIESYFGKRTIVFGVNVIM